MISDMEANKNISPILTELFLRGSKVNITLVFILQSYFKVLKTIRLDAIDYFIMKIRNKRELPEITSNLSSDPEFKDFMKLCKDYNKEPIQFLVNNTTLSSDNPLRFG